VQFLSPKLRLFLSADLVGSTAFKQNNIEDHAKWFQALRLFYAEVSTKFATTLQDKELQLSKVKHTIGENPELWKTVGDEIIFVKVLQEFHEVQFTLLSWIEAIESARKAIRAKSPQLEIKCTAWTAGFPVNNSEIGLENSPLIGAGFAQNTQSSGDDDQIYLNGSLLEKFYQDQEGRGSVVRDYVGPSMDIGFRISKLATVRKFIISTDVAYILANTNIDSLYKDIMPDLKIFFDGSAEHKGVNKGRPYPTFWIDMAEANGLDSCEDELLSKCPSVRDKIIKFIDQFYISCSDCFHRPFIISEKEKRFIKSPDNYEDKRLKLISIYESLKEQAGVGDPGDPDSPITTCLGADDILMAANLEGASNLENINPSSIAD
jgi:hypothetical protein